MRHNWNVRAKSCAVVLFVSLAMVTPASVASAKPTQVKPAYVNSTIKGCLEYTLSPDYHALTVKAGNGRTYVMTCHDVNHINGGHTIPVSQSGEFFLCVEYTLLFGTYGTAPTKGKQFAWTWPLGGGGSNTYVTDSPMSGTSNYEVSSAFTRGTVTNNWVACKNARP